MITRRYLSGLIIPFTIRMKRQPNGTSPLSLPDCPFTLCCVCSSKFPFNIFVSGRLGMMDTWILSKGRLTTIFGQKRDACVWQSTRFMLSNPLYLFCTSCSDDGEEEEEDTGGIKSAVNPSLEYLLRGLMKKSALKGTLPFLYLLL